MGFIDRTEKKFGKYAIEGLGFKLVVFQALTFLLLHSYDLKALEEKLNILNIGSTKIISDIILLVGLPSDLPMNTFSYIWLFFSSYILIMCANGVESVIGKYRFNLYILSYIFIGVIALTVIRSVHGIGIVELTYFQSNTLRMNLMSLIYVSVFISFAINYPNFEILFMFILPVKMKFLGGITALMGLFMIINSPSVLIMMYFFGTIFGPTILFHYKRFLESQAQKARTKEFTNKIAKNEAQSFNKCKVCGKTEKDDPDLEFRIADDGEEYCMEHLPKKNKKSS